LSGYVPATPNISQAWLSTLEYVQQVGGQQVNVLTTVTEPGAADDLSVRAVVDELLAPGRRKGTSIQTVDTVANTIFPAGLYRDPCYDWSPDLDDNAVKRLDRAAADLYEAYGEMLSLLCPANGNSSGTYFGRMTSWPGMKPGGVNQLAARIKYLRGNHKNRVRTQNVADIAIGGEAQQECMSCLPDIGIQVYAPTDRRQRGFPCLVHIDLTLMSGRLSMLAVYRHQYLITKAYGNLLGLSRLLAFLSQQTGFPMGELAVQATYADAERSTWGGKAGVDDLIRSARERVVT
jgi:hypothetical protein